MTTTGATDNRLLSLLAGRRPVLDGGFGWLLQERGLPPGSAGEVWNLENPEAVRALHDEYALAGSSILTTNTFGGTRARLAMNDLADRAVDINRAAAAAARAVADAHDVLVAGCLGPTGELMEPMGTLTDEQAVELYEEQLTGLVDGGIDLVIIETMSDLAEARAAITAAVRTAPGLPVIATMSFDTNLRTMMGTDPATAVRELAAAGADAAGANCGRGPHEMIQVAQQLVDHRPAEGFPLVAQGNAGLPQLEGGHFVYTVGPAEFGAHARELRDLGIDLIGGCCGSSPAHIRAVVEALGA